MKLHWKLHNKIQFTHFTLFIFCSVCKKCKPSVPFFDVTLALFQHTVEALHQKVVKGQNVSNVALTGCVSSKYSKVERPYVWSEDQTDISLMQQKQNWLHIIWSSEFGLTFVLCNDKVFIFQFMPLWHPCPQFMKGFGQAVCLLYKIFIKLFKFEISKYTGESILVTMISRAVFRVNSNINRGKERQAPTDCSCFMNLCDVI